MKKFVFLCTALTVAACGGAKMPSNLNDEKVFFAFDSAEITPEMAKDLQGQSLYMKKHPDINVTLEGHCDERGSTEYNLALGALRAGNAAHVMIKDGIEPSRIKQYLMVRNVRSILEPVKKYGRKTVTQQPA